MRQNSAAPPWNPTNFGGLIPNFLIFPAPGTPSPKPNKGRWEIRNDQSQQTNRGTQRSATELDGAIIFGNAALESDEFRRVRPKFPNIFWRRAPPPSTPNWGRREIRNYRRQKTNRGTPRNAAEPGGTPKFGQPALEYAIFWRTPPKFPNIFCAGHPLSQHPIGQGGCETTERKKKPIGTPRNLKERLNLANTSWNPPHFG